MLKRIRPSGKPLADTLQLKLNVLHIHLTYSVPNGLHRAMRDPTATELEGIALLVAWLLGFAFAAITLWRSL